MKPIVRFLYAIVLLALTLTACGPRPTATQAAPTLVPAPEATPTNPPPPIELITLDLSGPPAGTEMQWVDGGTMVFVPGGQFEMGAGGADNPEHVIALSSFWIYRTKVTNRMYGLCVSVGVCSPPSGEQAASDLLNRYLMDRPVVDVTWAQGQAYCEWVQGSLPTEAQWELTARGTENNVYPWGDAAPTCDLTNFKDCLGKTSRVFDYLNGRSPFNALDMAGNAFEWVADWYDNDYYPNGPEQDPPGPRVGTQRVVRGSSYESDAAEVPSALRFHEDPKESRTDLGFRCVVQNPQVFAPYCQTSAYVPGDPGEPPPSRSCEATNREVARDCGFVAHVIEHGGELRTIAAEPPLTCGVDGDGRIVCTGPGSTTGVVSAVVFCGTITPDDRLADPDCIAGYEPVPGSELHCEVITDGSEPAGTEGGGACPPGMTERPGPGGLTLCIEAREDPYIVEEAEPVLEGECPGGALPAADTGECPDPEGPVPLEEEEAGPLTPRDDCPRDMEAVTGPDGTVTCRGTTPDGTTVECPAGTFPVLTTEGIYCIGIGRGGRLTEPCPPGMYEVEGGRFCIGAARTGLPGSTPGPACIEGFTFDAALGCCQSPGGAYPGCSEDEYLDTAHGCEPRPDSSGAIVTIITFSASTGACGGPDPDNPCSGLDKTSCYATAGCTWDDPGSFCH